MSFGGSKSQNSSNQSSAGQNASQSQNMSGSFGINQSVNQSGNQSASNSSGSSWNNASSSQDVWGAQQPHLENVYNSAGDQYGQAINTINTLQPQVQGQITDQLNMAQGGYGNQMGGGFAGQLAGQVGPNSYVDALKGQVANDAALLKQQNLGGLDARAAAAGMSGSTGYRNQVGTMANNIDKSALNQMSQLGFQAHNAGVQNQIQLAGMMDANQQGAMGNLQNLQQGAMNQFNPAMTGLQATGMYGNIIGGPTVLGQSSSAGGSVNNSSSTSSGFSNGVSMGVQGSGSLGGSNGWGANAGQGASQGDSFGLQAGYV